MLAHNTITGDITLESVKLPKMKLSSNPYIAVCIPCGDKEDKTRIQCPKCNSELIISSGIRHPLLVPVKFMTDRDNLQTPLNTMTVTLVQAGMLSGEARQVMTKRALEMGVKFILYWDDDVLVTPRALQDMLTFLEQNPDVGAVNGVCMTRTEPSVPIIYREHGQGQWWDCPVGPGAVPQPVWSAGAGFLLARAEHVADVIEKQKAENDGVELPIWADEEIHVADADGGAGANHMWGHDVRFSRLMNTYGHPVYVHGQILCEHLDVATNTSYKVPDDFPGRLGPRDVPRPECVDLSTFVEPNPKVDIIVVTYDQPEYEHRAIKAIKDYTQYPNYRLIVHQNKPGIGMAKCWNQVIREQSTADYVCVVNSDTVVTPGWLTEMMKAFQNSEVGAAVPSSNHVHMSQIDVPIDRFEKDVDKIAEFGQEHLKQHSDSGRPLETASGMCAVFRRDVYDALGGFDEEFFFYGEDTWFFKKMTLEGYQIRWVVGSYVHHYGQQTLIPAAEKDGWNYEAERKRALELYQRKVKEYNAYKEIEAEGQAENRESDARI